MLQYRANFWMGLFGYVVVEIAVAYILWRSVYSDNPAQTMAGYTFSGLMFYYVTASIVDRLVRGGDFSIVGMEIYDGTLTRYLLYPVSILRFKYLQFIAYYVVVVVQIVPIFLVYWFFTGSDPFAQLTAINLLLFFVVTLLSGTFYFLAVACIDLVGFWAENVWSLSVMLKISTKLLGGLTLPLAFFPELAQRVMFWLPFRFLAAYPAELLTGKQSLEHLGLDFVVLVFWLLVTAGVFRVVWRRGISQYTGVGI